MNSISVILAFSAILIQPSLSRKRRFNKRLDGDLDWVTSFRLERYDENGTLFYSSSHMCGGALIQKSPPVILTAAHCIDEAGPYINEDVPFAIDIGRKQKDEADGDHQTIYVTDGSSFHVHPNWDRSSIDSGYDIGLIIVTDPEQTIDKDVGPLPRLVRHLEEEQVCCDDDETLRQIGYSDDEESILEIDTIHYVAGDECLAAFDQDVHWTQTGNYLHHLYDEEGEVSPRLVCAQKDGDGTCHGDSGMPLVRRRQSKKKGMSLEIVGVVSYGEECPADEDARGYPDMWTSVGHFADWIGETLDEVLGENGESKSRLYGWYGCNPSSMEDFNLWKWFFTFGFYC